MAKLVQLFAFVPAGAAVDPEIVDKTGNRSPFVIPDNSTFVLTDITILQPPPGTPSIALPSIALDFVLQQPHGDRWRYNGPLTANFERDFTTGIEFGTTFKMFSQSTSTGDVLVYLSGYFT